MEPPRLLGCGQKNYGAPTPPPLPSGVVLWGSLAPLLYINPLTTHKKNYGFTGKLLLYKWGSFCSSFSHPPCPARQCEARDFYMDSTRSA
jgi:hypothetical protein